MTASGQPFDTAAAWAEIEAQQAARTRLADEARPQNKAAILAALAQAGIGSVLVTFDGSGDSGQIEDIAAFTDGDMRELPTCDVTIQVPLGDGWAIDRRILPFKEAIEQLAYDLLEEAHDGWEINEGAYGEFSFDVASDTIRLDYNQRIETSEYSGHTW